MCKYKRGLEIKETPNLIIKRIRIKKDKIFIEALFELDIYKFSNDKNDN